MAELLSANGWPEPDSLGAHLGADLPGDYIVVEGPVPYGQPLDVVVVGPQGLFVVHSRDWTGTITLTKRGAWRGELPSGQAVQHTNPAREARQASKALTEFLRDRFPSIHPQIRQLLVLTDRDATIGTFVATNPVVVTLRDAVSLIRSRASEAGKSLPDADVRKELALALVEGRLSASQRTSEPFIFRSGGGLASGRKVWTLRDAVKHMDRNPEDGVFHLQNGTLARWLNEEGATELSEVARQAVQEHSRDPRAGLEVFLVQTGLVKRRPLRVRPKVVNLGYVLSGQSCNRRLHVRKGRGRGYLLGTLEAGEPWLRVDPGTLEAGEPWLRVDPSTVNGSSTAATVTARTDGLPISPKPYTASISVESGTGAPPVAIPVRIHVRGTPSSVSKNALRPLFGLIAGGVLGAAIGWALGSWGFRAPDALPGPAFVPRSSPAVYATWVGALGAFLGALRGVWQPPAWPVSYSLGHWLARLGLWTVALSIVAVAGQWSWWRLSRNLALGLAGPSVAAVVLTAAALAMVPAAVGEIGAGRRARREPEGSGTGIRLRPVWVGALAGALLVVVGLGGHLVVPLWRRLGVAGYASSAQAWAEERFVEFDTRFNEFFNSMTLESYDRRAPIRPTLAPGPTESAPTPSPEGEASPTPGGSTS